MKVVRGGWDGEVGVVGAGTKRRTLHDSSDSSKGGGTETVPTGEEDLLSRNERRTDRGNWKGQSRVYIEESLLKP